MNFYQQPCYGMGFGQTVVPQPLLQPSFFPNAALGQPLMPDQFMTPPSGISIPGISLPNEQSYIENILRLNIGKVATVYMNFENSQWGSKIFKGTILAAGKDHLILKDLNSETRFLLLSIYLDYITFDEEINYDYPFRKVGK